MPLCGVDRIGALGEVSPGVFAVEAKARQRRHVLPVATKNPPANAAAAGLISQAYFLRGVSWFRRPSAAA